MDVFCPECRSAIPMDDVNVATDIALCRRCGKRYSFVELVGDPDIAAPDLALPPSGAWFEHLGDGFRVGATTRSWWALPLVPIAAYWGGQSLSGIYGGQIASGRFDPRMSLFGLPFLIGSVFLIGLCAMTIAGKVEVSQHGNDMTVFTGVGWLGWKRRYSRSDFASVREDIVRGGWNWRRGIAAIVLEGRRRADFGSMLSAERRYFVVGALRQMLWNRARTSGGPFVPFR